MLTLLVVTQTIAVVLLGAVRLFPSLQKRDGGVTSLNRAGRVLFAAGVAVFLATTVSIHRLAAAEADRAQQRVEAAQQKLNAAQDRIAQLLEEYFSATAERVMSRPGRLGGPPPSPSAQDVIRIEAPRDGAEVPQRFLVEGAVSGVAKEVWLIVHPVGTSSYWVQPAVSVRAGGAWSAAAYFGRSGDRDAGMRFEVLAITDPSEHLREGEILDKWPKAGAASQVVIVVRR
jgi:hypothetical protein